MLEDSHMKRLMTSVECANCGKQYLIENIEVLGHEDGLWFLKLLCTACQSESLTAAVIEENDEHNHVDKLDDLKLVNSPELTLLTASEMLNMHNYLKGSDRDYTKLFSMN